MNTDHLILLCAWALFGITHSLLASDRVTAACRKVLGRHFIYFRPLYSGIAVLSLAGILLWQFSIPGFAAGSFPMVKWLIGMPAGCLGIWLTGVSIRKYFFNHSGIAELMHKQPAPFLESGGIHRHIRHPLYMGTLLVIWSLFLFFPSLANLIACGMITGYTLIGIRLEERKLLRRFGESYAAYRRRTPMLIPGDLPLKFLYRIKALFQP